MINQVFERVEHTALTLSQTSPGFYMSAAQVFWKHWEEEKLLITSNFSFSRSVSTHLENFLPF